MALALVAPWCARTEEPEGEADENTPEPESPLPELRQTVRGVRIRPTDEGTAIAETLEVRKRVTQVESVAEVLSDAVGVQVRRSGGLGSFGAASIRGSTPEQVPVYLDGVLLNAGGFSAVDLGDLSLDHLDTIEIYRGSAPVRFATTGIGGALVLKTREFTRPRTEIATSYGSWNTARLFALCGDRVGDQRLLAVLSLITSTGDFEHLDRRGTLKNPDDDRIRRRQNNQHLAASGLLKLDGAIGAWRFTLANDLFAKDQGLAGIENIRIERTHLARLRDALTLRTESELGPGFDLALEASYLALRESLDDVGGELSGERVRLHSTTDAVGGGATLDLTPCDDHRSTVKVDLRWERFGQRERIAGWEADAKQRLRTTLALQHEWKPAEGLSLRPAFRLDLLHDRFGGGPDPTRVEELEPDESFEALWQPALGLRYEPLPGLVLRANGGRYVRSPSLSELFGYGGVVASNPDLKIETSWNADAGASFQLTGLGVLTHLRLSVAWFGALVEDLILLVPRGPDRVAADNVDDAEIAGLESGIRLLLWNTVALSGNYTFLRAINTTDDPLYSGKQLPGRPVHEAYGRLELRLAGAEWRIRLWGDVDYAGKNFFDRANYLADEVARVLVGIGLKLERPRERLTLTLEVKNLLDTITLTDKEGLQHPLRDYLRFPLPGRTVMATLHWRS